MASCHQNMQEHGFVSRLPVTNMTVSHFILFEIISVFVFLLFVVAFLLFNRHVASLRIHVFYIIEHNGM